MKYKLFLEKHMHFGFLIFKYNNDMWNMEENKNPSTDYLRMAITSTKGNVEDWFIATVSLWQSTIPCRWTLDLTMSVVFAKGVLVPMIQAQALDVLV